MYWLIEIVPSILIVGVWGSNSFFLAFVGSLRMFTVFDEIQLECLRFPDIVIIIRLRLMRVIMLQ